MLCFCFIALPLLPATTISKCNSNSNKIEYHQCAYSWYQPAIVQWHRCPHNMTIICNANAFNTNQYIIMGRCLLHWDTHTGRTIISISHSAFRNTCECAFQSIILDTIYALWFDQKRNSALVPREQEGSTDIKGARVGKHEIGIIDGMKCFD